MRDFYAIVLEGAINETHNFVLTSYESFQHEVWKMVKHNRANHNPNFIVKLSLIRPNREELNFDSGFYGDAMIEIAAIPNPRVHVAVEYPFIIFSSLFLFLCFFFFF